MHRHGGCMVTYGGMSRRPVTVPTAPFIFRDLTLRGFWMTRWTQEQDALAAQLAHADTKTTPPPPPSPTGPSLDDRVRNVPVTRHRYDMIMALCALHRQGLLRPPRLQHHTLSWASSTLPSFRDQVQQALSHATSPHVPSKSLLVFHE